jgi:hypothetical protein
MKKYYVHCRSIVEAESPQLAADQFAKGVLKGNIWPNVVFDRDPPNAGLREQGFQVSAANIVKTIQVVKVKP